MPRKTVDPILRFWKFVNRDGNCWIWQGACNDRGRGMFQVAGRALFATRFLWQESFGPIPTGFGVGHDCDNPRCVRPSHLYLTTKGDNNRRRHERGRDRNSFTRFMPAIPRPPRKTLRDRFEARVLVNDGCWLWTGALNQDGYGLISNSRINLVEKAHRVSWKLYHGPIPEGQKVLHSCHTPRCVNPTHLHLGSQADNNREREEAGRGNQQRGEKHGRAKLTAQQVLEIRRLHENGLSLRKLAAQFKVSDGTISYVVRRINWAWL